MWYPSEWQRLTDRERVILFPERREIVADQPEQFTRAQLSQFAHLVDTTGSGAYIYEIRREDVWQAPYDSFEDLRSTVRSVLPERSDHLESWMEEQYRRANQFTLRTHDEGYVVLEAASADLMGNVARQELEDGQLRATISETESWVAQESVAELKRVLYEAGYPVQDERDLEAGEDLPVELRLELRDYQQEWLSRFLETNSGVLVGPPGSGKTVAAMAILAAIEGETLILVPGRELAGQWREELLAHTSLQPDQIGEYHGGEKKARPVTIATYRTAGMDRHRQLFDSREWGLIVFDECLSGDTVVETEAGRTTFEALDTKLGLREGWNRDVDLRVRSFDTETNSYEWESVTGIYKTASEVNRIETNTGHGLTATADHTHLVFDPDTGKVLEQEGVEPGDFLVRPLPEPERDTTSEITAMRERAVRAELLGWFVGDGHYDRREHVKFSFARKASEQIAIVAALCDRLGIEYSTFENSRGDVTLWSAELPEKLQGLGTPGAKATSIRLPRDCYGWDSVEQTALLRGLFDAEGSVDTKSRIQFNTVSEGLADDVVALLQKSGIPTLRMTICRDKDRHNTVFRLNIPAFYSGRFAQCIDFRLSHKSERLAGGESPETGLPVGGMLKKIKDNCGLTNERLAGLMGVARQTVGEVIRGRHRLGQPHLSELADGLAEYGSGLPERHDSETLRTYFNITYECLGERLGVTSGGAYSRLERREPECVDMLIDIADSRKRKALEYARRLQTASELNILEVTTVERGDTEPVYDFETESHTFIADGFLTHNCQHIPADVYRRSADLQTRHRLGLSSTPVREDDREEDIFTLIGPPIGTDWDALFESGFVAEPTVEIIYVPWGTEEAQNEYVSADGHERRQLAASNPAKAEEIERLLARHPEEKALVFVEYLDQGRAYADRLDAPFISGETPHHRREKLFEQFREGTLSTLVVSRVGDEGIDLPSAELAVVASGLGGSRRQGAQRAGRTMRPSGRARMYVLATRGTREEEFARQRTRHLAEKGVRVTERDSETIDGDSY